MKKDKELSAALCGMLKTLIEAAEHLQRFLYDGQMDAFRNTLKDIQMACGSIYRSALQIPEEAYAELSGNCRNLSYSLMKIQRMASRDTPRACHKIEFELIPIIRSIYIRFYFYSSIYPNKGLMGAFFEKEMMQLCENRYIENSVKSGEYKYDITISITGYNKLEYTKKCVESVLRTMPRGLKCELILVNHGSNDGTEEYFNQVGPTKQIDLQLNGKIKPLYFIKEGKYALDISNDIVVMENSIQNMYDCMEENADIGWIVPSTTNISNLQTIPVPAGSLEEICKFSARNNKRDPRREEQRVRLCNPIDMVRNELYLSSRGLKVGAFNQLRNSNWLFPDDEFALMLRRRGIKQVLMKDAFCYHFGSITIKDEHLSNKSYLDGRKAFYSQYGIDPWGTGFCYSAELFNSLKCTKTGMVKILGINCGLGSNSLKIKEALKEQAGNFNAILHNASSDIAYSKDLKGISDRYFHFTAIEELIKKIDSPYDYIIFEDGIQWIEVFWKIIKKLEMCLAADGILILKLPKAQHRAVLENRNHAAEAGDWIFWCKPS